MKIIDDSGNISIVNNGNLSFDILSFAFDLTKTDQHFKHFLQLTLALLIPDLDSPWSYIVMDPHHQNSFSYVREVETNFPSSTCIIQVE